MDKRPFTPTSKDISPEEIDKAVDKYKLKYDRRPAMLYLHPYDFRMLRQICAYDKFVENEEGFFFMFLTFVPVGDVPIGGWYLDDRPIELADGFKLSVY